MESIGLQELRQHVSEIVRRAEAGEELLVTVAGRPAAMLGPATPSQWRRYHDIEAIFAGQADAAWTADRERIDQSLGDAWLR